jgi:hypothetical protein
LAAAVACTDTPTALARAPGTAAERQTDNIDPYGGCPSAAVQQFYDYYGYEPDGISCTWGGSGWYIDISFYWDDYDPYFDWYQWLLNNSYTIDESCGDQVLDGIIASYYNSSYYTGTEIPTCHEFNQTTSTQ